MIILDLDKIAGFKASNWRTRVCVRGTRYRIMPAGVCAIKLAVKILWLTEHKYSLFSLRSEIRAVRETLCKAALTHLIETTTNDQLLLIAIWLRGQCGGYLGTETLAKYSTADAEAVRLKVAGALHRMSGWGVLARMAACDPSPRVRRRASSRAPREFDLSLRQYAKKVAAIPFAERAHSLTTPMYLATVNFLSMSKAPKPVEYIRAILERIRRLNKSL